MKIYAHRGSSSAHAELTMASFKAAIDDGADGFECDVRLTKDKQIVLWHDPDLQRITGSKARVSNLTFKEIQLAYPQAIVLSDLLELARDNKKDLAIETKHPVPTGSAVEYAVMDLISQEENKNEIYIMSFSWLALENIRKIDISQKTVSLVKTGFSKAMFTLTSATAIGPEIDVFIANPALQRDSRELFVWTVDKPEEIRFCANNAVDVLITNDPSQARSVLGYH